MNPIAVRQYKPAKLTDGTLIVSIPHLGVGSLLVTDFLLQELNMDQVACLQSESFPPIAMLRQGKPRAPARIHADPSSRVAVLRCEFNLPPHFALPVAQSILAWSTTHKLKRIIALDGLLTSPEAQRNPRAPEILFSSGQDSARASARAAGLHEFESGILGGVPATLLLESKFQSNVDVLALLAVFDDAVQDARSSLAFAAALHKLLPDLRFDAHHLEAQVEALGAEVRTLQENAQKALARLFKRAEGPAPMYG